jgi:hypothetical protein
MGETCMMLEGELEMVEMFLGGAMYGKMPFRGYVCRENGNLKMYVERMVILKSAGIICDMMLNLGIL